MFVLIVGPMFSGKSSLLLNYERRFTIAKKKRFSLSTTLLIVEILTVVKSQLTIKSNLLLNII